MPNATAFERLLQLFSSGDDNTGLEPPAPTPEVDGEPGERTLEWTLDAIDRDLVDPDFLIDTLEEVGVKARKLFHSQEDEEEGVWTQHELLVGQLEERDEECWALMIDCNLMEDANFESSAEMELLEGKRAVEARLQQIHQQKLQYQALEIFQLIEQATQQDPTKLLAIRQAMIEQGAQGVFAVWDAHAMGKKLEEDTAAAPRKGPKAGRL